VITREVRKGHLFADRYRVIRRLGAGGMATVWLAQDERLGRQVAIKRLSTAAPDESLSRFNREARLGATLNHPNLVSVFDTIATDEGPLIVMEYVPGQSVAQLAERGPMDPEQVVSILRGAATALDHAHSEGVVHRDIKPANILVRDDGTVKLADLGIARALDATQITTEGQVIGTVPYMAPERMEAAGAGGPESDVYALAAVAYELLSGTPVVAAATGEPDRQALAERWPEAPAAALTVLAGGLSRDRAQRQSTAGELVAELEDALSRGEADTRSFMPPTVPRTRPRRDWTPSRSVSGRPRLGAEAGLALVALVGLIVAGIALFGGGSGDEPAPNEKSAGREAGSDAGGSEEAAAAPAAEDVSLSAAEGARLNETGFSLLKQGRAAEALPILQRAVESFPEGTTDLNYAYALYNLGNALRLAGRPEEAIPILERRLRIPNQRSTVAAELARARAEAGAD
jgi:serine/threonine-protein kinase